MRDDSTSVATRPHRRWTGERGRLSVATEVLYIGVFYFAYRFIRNTQGSARDAHTQAFTNATRVLRWERLTHLDVEKAWQKAFLGARALIQFLNTWYGTAHFVVTIAALLWCYRRAPERYRTIRNALALMTGIALVGYVFFPLMPPRLLPKSYGFVDTLKTYGGPWSFESGAIAKQSNQYAAMPSLHFGWAAWCTYAFWNSSRRLPVRLLLLVYPLLTLFTIVVTANHYVLDAVGGLGVFVFGFVFGRWLDRAAIIDRLRLRRVVD